MIGFQFKEVSLEVEITAPDGKTEMLPVTMKLIDDSGKDLGDCSGDICDVFSNHKNLSKFRKRKI